MDEIFLQKLLSSEFLSEEAKTELSAQWTQAVTNYKAQLKEEVTLSVRAELAEQWNAERDVLLEAVDTFVEKALSEELDELKEELERFRDLEVEYAEKIVEEKHKLAQTLGEELDTLVDKMDAFFEYRLTEELEELKEDLTEARKNDFGRKVFEAFSSEYSKFADDDTTQARLAAALDKLNDAENKIAELSEEQDKMIREAKLKTILEPLSGKKREQMEFVLANVETQRLEEAYSRFIDRILKDDAKQVDSKPTQIKESTTVVTGNSEATKISQPGKYSELKKFAGLS